MTEPHEVAEAIEEVVPGVYHWRIRNSNIGGAISSSHAVVRGDDCIFIDPVRLGDDCLAKLPAPTAIVLTARTHQRASWRYRGDYGAQVWMPADAPAAEEEPDRLYEDGATLPGGLLAFRTPGPEWPHYSLLLEEDPGIVFVSDLVSRDDAGGLRVINPDFHDDPEQTRRSIEGLLDLPFSILCLDHGAPLTSDPQAELRRVVQSCL
jgi:glyoxylase-like metal-dependent hydrolase (beta-lactamase superfamily II)